MNNNSQKQIMTIQNTLNIRKGNATSWNDECSVLICELKKNSSLIIHNISLGGAAWLKEIQR